MWPTADGNVRCACDSISPGMIVRPAMFTTRAVPWSSRQPERTSTMRSPSTTTSPGAGSVPVASNTAPPVNTVRSIVSSTFSRATFALRE